jgi:hypothetical protein
VYSLAQCVALPFNTHRIALISGALSGPTSKLTWKIKFRSIRNCTKGMAIDTCVENSSGAVLKALASYTLNCHPRDDPRPPILAGIQDEILLKNRLRRQWQITRDTALKTEVNRLQNSMTRRPNECRKRPVEHETRIPRP